LKVEHYSKSDQAGGAARAAYRIHQALRAYDVDTTMVVDRRLSNDWTVRGPTSGFGKMNGLVRGPVGGLLVRTLKTENNIIHSPAWLPSFRVEDINRSKADIIHLHWINGEMLSVKDIGAIRKPLLWTLHDMWAFCGAEHVTDEFRWKLGYLRSNRPAYESGFDINLWAWNRKLKYWKKPINLVTPSHWLSRCVSQSALMKDWPVSVIPNAIDTDTWKPYDKTHARELLGLPLDVPILLFGANDGVHQFHKGFDLLETALLNIYNSLPDLQLLVFGQDRPQNDQKSFPPVHYIGHLYDNLSLRVLYSAADAVVIPSRIDNFPNIAIEATACGLPVIAFDVCGLSDIVSHKETGYLARPFDVDDFTTGIVWTVSDTNRNLLLGAAARSRAETLWSSKVVAEKYYQAYQNILDYSFR
jgi:glycosyltransferase involved in cell wall biosynthesis